MAAVAVAAGLGAIIAAIIEVLIIAIIAILIIAAIILVAYILYKLVEFVRTWPNETADDVWDDTAPAPPIEEPVPVPETEPIETPIPIPIPIPIPLTVPLDRTKTADPGPYNVYDVHVNIAGDYGDYTRGVPDPTDVSLGVGEIYKYGITMFGSVMKRYETFQWANPKEAMILRNLRNGSFGPYEWYVFRRSKEFARAVEDGLIAAYVGIRGKFPPGNTGYY